MMTTGDYIRTLKKYQEWGLNNLENISISDMLDFGVEHNIFSIPDFESINAEDNVYQLCSLLKRLNVNYVPIIDPEEGSLVAVLGYQDILHMLAQTCHVYPTVFSVTLESLSIVNYHSNAFQKTTPLSHILSVMEGHPLLSSGCPVSDSQGRVVGIYQNNNVAFMSKCASESTLKPPSLSTISVMEVLTCQHELLGYPPDNESQSTNAAAKHAYRCTCIITDSIKTIIEQMVKSRITKLVVTDSFGTSIVGTVDLKDIIWFYFNQNIPSSTA
jgi:CBS domain-containing protein